MYAAFLRVTFLGNLTRAQWSNCSAAAVIPAEICCSAGSLPLSWDYLGSCQLVVCVVPDTILSHSDWDTVYDVE
jgi:hypothetical protein